MTTPANLDEGIRGHGLAATGRTKWSASWVRNVSLRVATGVGVRPPLQTPPETPQESVDGLAVIPAIPK